jgi:hypothetical protein
MTKVAVPARRSILVNTSNGMEFVIPTKKNWFLIFFLGFWMCGWVFGELSAIKELFVTDNGIKLFMIVWLGGWTIGGIFAGFFWLWTFRGKEHIILRPDALITKREVFNIGQTREYEIANIRNLRIAPLHFNPFNFSSSMQIWGFGGGLIAFDYGAKTYRFGNGLDESEASDIVNQLQAQHNFSK